MNHWTYGKCMELLLLRSVGLSTRGLAAFYRVSPSRIRQVEDDAHRKLRSRLRNSGLRIGPDEYLRRLTDPTDLSLMPSDMQYLLPSTE